MEHKKDFSMNDASSVPTIVHLDVDAFYVCCERELRPEKSMLDVAADNLGAIAFYESLGFFAEGRRIGYYKRLEGNRIDAILMTKR